MLLKVELPEGSYLADVGEPCPICNPSDADNPPAMPNGFVADLLPGENDKRPRLI